MPERLERFATENNSILCFGIDPSGEEKDIYKYYTSIVDALLERRLVSAIKPNYAYFAAQGFNGLKVLKRPQSFFTGEIRYAIKGRAIDTLEGYLRLERSGRGTPLQESERRAVWSVYEGYQKRLKDQGLWDYDDFIVEALRLIQAGQAPDQYMDVYWRDWPGYSEDADGVYNGTIHVNNYGNSPDFSDELQFTGFTIGDDFCPLYRFRETRYDAFSTSIISQVNKTNQLKAGLEYRKYSISWDSKQFFNPNPYGEKYKSKPAYASLFLEDKMEYDHVIVNLGVRYDYRDADISYNITP